MNLLRRGPLALVAVMLAASLTLTGCGFWDWLAGRPISQPVGPDPGQTAEPPADSGDQAGAGDAGDPGEPGSDQPGAQDPPAGEEPAGEAEPGGGVALDPCAPYSAGAEPSPGPFEVVTIEPVDEAGEDASFAEFRDALLDILESRDEAALAGLLHPDIQVSFGGDAGVEAFREHWGLHERPEDSAVWTVLRDILQLGGVFTDADHTTFVAPYVFALYNARLDPFTHSVITGAGVNIRAQPSLDAEVLDKATHVVVRLIKPDAPLPTVELGGRTYCWARIQLPTGEIGYVADRFLWSPVGYRASFIRNEDGWKMNFLLAGD